MPRAPQGTWDARRGVWVAALGDWYETPRGRRRRQVTLTDAHGTPIAERDRAGRLEAIARLVRRNAHAETMGSPWTLAGLIQAWADWHQAQGTTPASHATRRDLGQRILNLPAPGGGRLGGLPIIQVGHETLFAVRAALRARGVAEGGIRNHEAVLLAAIRWAATAIEGRSPLVLLPRNPFPPQSVRSPSGYRSERPCPDWDEAMAILARMDAWVDLPQKGLGEPQRRQRQRNALMVRIIAERGCRPSEVVPLRIEQWDDAQNGFVLVRHKTVTHGIPGVIPLRPETADRVREVLADQGRVGPWVFWPDRPEDRPPRDPKENLGVWWAKHRASFGAKAYTLYAFRNTVSNHLRRHGVDGRQLQVALRQGSAVADTVYRRDDLEAASAAFARAGLD